MVGLAQLSRGAETEQGRKPLLSDFKESSGLEEAADLAILVHRPNARMPTDSDGKYIYMDNDAELCLVKNKDGGLGDIPVTFNRPLMRYEEPTVGATEQQSKLWYR